MAALFERDDPDLADCLRTVDDPEIGLNIVDLGLVVHARRTSDEIDVQLTLTSRACPLGEMVMGDVRSALASRFPRVHRIAVELVWNEPWTADHITDDGYAQLGRTRKKELI
ncbi:MAG: metal-sulfur cluster assembly factor [Massilia sp.]|nr:MAG: metal-sulfur cluster assembly factor [Massilia sp.]